MNSSCKAGDRDYLVILIVSSIMSYRCFCNEEERFLADSLHVWGALHAGLDPGHGQAHVPAHPRPLGRTRSRSRGRGGHGRANKIKLCVDGLKSESNNKFMRIHANLMTWHEMSKEFPCKVARLNCQTVFVQSSSLLEFLC